MTRLAVLLLPAALLVGQSTSKLDTTKFWAAARRADTIAYEMKHPKPGAPKVDMKLANALATAMGEMAAERRKLEKICGTNMVLGFDIKSEKSSGLTCLTKAAAAQGARKR